MKYAIAIIFFICFTFNIPGGDWKMTDSQIAKIEKSLFYYQIKDLPFSESLLKIVIFLEEIENPDVVLLQAQLETGFYTSDIFMNGHNLFGMKYPKFRSTVATGEYQGHSQYNHWIDSVIDYKLWQDWFKSIGYRFPDDPGYLVFLKCIGYAEDPHYIFKLVKLGKDIS